MPAQFGGSVSWRVTIHWPPPGRPRDLAHGQQAEARAAGHVQAHELTGTVSLVGLVFTDDGKPGFAYSDFLPGRHLAR